MKTADEVRALVRAGGVTRERQALFEAHFASGPPRKLRALGSRVDLARARVLDVGCGHGTYLVHFAPGSVGVDRDPARVDFARSLGLDARVRDVEVSGWTRTLGTFDVVWLCDMLVHVREPSAFLASLDPLLHDRSALALVEWLWPKSDALARAVARIVPGGIRTLDEPEHLHRFDRATLPGLLAAAGFAVEAQWLHTFESAAARALFGAWWPPRTILARRMPASPS